MEYCKIIPFNEQSLLVKSQMYSLSNQLFAILIREIETVELTSHCQLKLRLYNSRLSQTFPKELNRM